MNPPDGVAGLADLDALAATRCLAAAGARSIRAVDAVLQRRPAIGLSLRFDFAATGVGAYGQWPARYADDGIRRIAHAAYRLVECVFRAGRSVDARLQAAADAIGNARRIASDGVARPRSSDSLGRCRQSRLLVSGRAAGMVDGCTFSAARANRDAAVLWAARGAAFNDRADADAASFRHGGRLAAARRSQRSRRTAHRRRKRIWLGTRDAGVYRDGFSAAGLRRVISQHGRAGSGGRRRRLLGRSFTPKKQKASRSIGAIT